MKNILVISHDKVGKAMAGPGIRYHQIAKELSRHFDVTLGVFNPEYLDNVGQVPYKYQDIKVFNFKPVFDKFDAIFALWLSDEMISYAKQKGKILIFDLYAPVPVEELVARIFAGKTDAQSDYDYITGLRNYKKIFQAGDYFVCSNPIQKDLWSGYALAAESSLPSSYSDFPLYNRLGLLPMGIDTTELPLKKPFNPFPNHFPSIKKDDFIVVWTGGIWDWFDAITPIKAIGMLHKKGLKNIKLVFLGTRHPNKDVPEMAETTAAYSMAGELKLRNKAVFFLEGWIEYSNRLPYLMNASVALYAHKPSIEARFSHRTRVLDHLLCGLPTVATDGDYLGSVVEKREYGIVVPPQNPISMADALERLSTSPPTLEKFRNNIGRDRELHSWSVSTQELLAFLKSKPSPRKEYHMPLIIATRPGTLSTKMKRLVPQKVKNTAKKYLKKPS